MSDIQANERINVDTHSMRKLSLSMENINEKNKSN